MQFRDIFTSALIKDPELLQLFTYALNNVSNVHQDVTIGAETIALPTKCVVIEYDSLQFLINKDREYTDGITQRLEQMKKIEVIRKTDSYCVVKIKGIHFPICPVLDVPDPKSTLIPIEFDEWKRKDLKFIERELSKKYVELAKYAFRYFSNVAGEKMLHEITRGEYDAFVAHIRTREVSDRTINNYTRCLKASFNRAKEKEHIAINPFEKIKPIKTTRENHDILSRDEVHYLITFLRNPILRACVLFTFGTGMRKGEVTYLRWSDIGEDNIIVRSSIEYRTKFGKERQIPQNPSLHGLLKNCKQISIENGIDSEFVFPNDQGKHFHENYLLTAVKRAAKRAGFSKRIEFHTFRRSYASLLKKNGVKTDIIAGLLGHSDERVTKQYLSVFEEDMERAMQSIDLTGGKNVGTLLLQNT